MLTKHAGKSPVDLQLCNSWERGTDSEANAPEDGRRTKRQTWMSWDGAQI